MTVHNTSLKDLEGALIETMSPKALGPKLTRFAATVIRELAQGTSVPLERVAKQTGMDHDDAKQALLSLQSMGFADLDSEHRLHGMVLCLGTTRHGFRVGERQLYAWCALDALFLPAVLGETADIASSCPMTDRAIHLKVSPLQVLSAAPQSVWVSVVAPGVTPGVDASCSATLAGGDGAFCGKVHFLATEKAAQAWLDENPGSAVLPLQDAFDFAQTVWAQRFLAEAPL